MTDAATTKHNTDAAQPVSVADSEAARRAVTGTLRDEDGEVARYELAMIAQDARRKDLPPGTVETPDNDPLRQARRRA